VSLAYIIIVKHCLSHYKLACSICCIYYSSWQQYDIDAR